MHTIRAIPSNFLLSSGWFQFLLFVSLFEYYMLIGPQLIFGKFIQGLRNDIHN